MYLFLVSNYFVIEFTAYTYHSKLLSVYESHRKTFVLKKKPKIIVTYSITVTIKDDNFVSYLTKDGGPLILPEGFDLPTFARCDEDTSDEEWSDNEV